MYNTNKPARATRNLALAALALACAAGPALAAFPKSVVGTWNMVANQTELILVISTQGATGVCRLITGTLTPAATNIQGFYCPSSGIISFLRKDPVNNDTFQVFKGNAHITTATDRLSGAFDHISLPYGQYGWYAAK